MASQAGSCAMSRLSARVEHRLEPILDDPGNPERYTHHWLWPGEGIKTAAGLIPRRWPNPAWEHGVMAASKPARILVCAGDTRASDLPRIIEQAGLSVHVQTETDREAENVPDF